MWSWTCGSVLGVVTGRVMFDGAVHVKKITNGNSMESCFYFYTHYILKYVFEC